jgi:nitroimidazol reductase NimA-like FMN-containing flavoprotein (pyridoxamine 5'-phosphate oxidase superfamily)
MRRTEKAITDKDEILEILSSEKVCRIALSDDLMPYVVPVNYGYENNALYIHSAKSGKKIEIIEKNDAICFEIEKDVEIVPADNACTWTTRYVSVIGCGRAELLLDHGSVTDALEVIMRQQSGREGWSYGQSQLKNVVIIKINIDSISGKRSV